MRPLFERLREGRPWRAWSRYSDARGSVLAAGVSFFAFFSIFPAIALAFTVFGFVLRGHPELLASVADQLHQNLPGFVRDAGHPDGIIPTQAPRAATLTMTGVIAFTGLVLAGLGWLGATRQGIRAVFGVQGPGGSLFTNKLRDLGVILGTGGRGRVQSAEALGGHVAAARDCQPSVRLARDRGRLVVLAQPDCSADPDLGGVGCQRR